VEILDIDHDKQRLSLGLKQTQKDPWLEKIKKFKANDIVQGKVTRIVKFGLFVQIESGMEGLVHISELSDEPIKRPSDIAKIGDELIVRIIDIDFDKRRMAFSVNQVEHPEIDEGKKEKAKEKEKVKDKEKVETSSKTEEVKTSAKKTEKIKPVESQIAEEGKVGKKSKKEEAKSETGEEITGISPEEKKETIKKLLKEMKKEANIE
jgi:small subunit ribosomal protein S1